MAGDNKRKRPESLTPLEWIAPSFTATTPAMAGGRRRGPLKSDGESSVDTSKPTAVFKPSGRGIKKTVSIAIPSSIIANCQTQESKTALAGNIARALAVFCIDEVIIFEDGTVKPTEATTSNGHDDSAPPVNTVRKSELRAKKKAHTDIIRASPNHVDRYRKPLDDPKPDDSYTGNTDPGHFLMHLLIYLETPPFLRRRLFPQHPNLVFAGQLPSVDMPHHLRADEEGPYREGVTVKNVSSDPVSTSVDVGYTFSVAIKGQTIADGTRVTVKANGGDPLRPGVENQQGILCHPTEPREKIGLYWGYSIRRANKLSDVVVDCPFSREYDIAIGTSERGRPLDDLMSSPRGTSEVTFDLHENGFQHLLVVFGGVSGLELAMKNDPMYSDKNPMFVFREWINLLPRQGSRTIRTEEAIWIALSKLDPWVKTQQER